MQSSIYSKDKEIFNKVLKLREIQSVDIRFSIAVNSTIFSLILMILILNILKKIFNRK